MGVVGTVVGHSRVIHLHGTGRAVGLRGGGRRVGGLFEALARILLASPGPTGLFYSIGGSTVTLDPNGLFFAGSRGIASLSSGAGLGGPPVGFDVGVLVGPAVGSDVGRHRSARAGLACVGGTPFLRDGDCPPIEGAFPPGNRAIFDDVVVVFVVRLGPEIKDEPIVVLVLAEDVLHEGLVLTGGVLHDEPAPSRRATRGLRRRPRRELWSLVRPLVSRRASRLSP